MLTLLKTAKYATHAGKPIGNKHCSLWLILYLIGGCGKIFLHACSYANWGRQKLW